MRGGAGPPLKVTLGIAVALALALAAAIGVLLPPRGAIDDPQYYAHGPDIPGALQAVEAVQRSGAVLDQELDAQLVGLARLVAQPGARTTIAGRPDITVASDLHNNSLGVSILARNSHRNPVFFVGDLTDRGSPLETRADRADRPDRSSVRVRQRQPRLGLAEPPARPRRRDRPDPVRAVEARRRVR